MVRVGILGLGFMGRMHYKCYKALDNVSIVAVCDIDENKFKDTGEASGNIEGAEESLDLTGIKVYADFDKMLAESELDAVSITMPTFLHKDFTIKALKAGVNVLCEKPMALNVEDCEEMVEAARKAGRIFQVGHCIRFWPEYVKTKQIIDSGDFGRVLTASFRRVATAPTWSWDNWLMAGAKSGGALLDLHIHDSDFVQYVFGMPNKVFTQGIKGPSGVLDYVVTQYIYADEKLITAEGGWMVTPSFGFEMSFNIVLEKAVIVFDFIPKPAFKIYPQQDEPFTPQLEAGDGWSREIAHFVKAVSGEKVPEIITPRQSLDSIRLVLAERTSAQTGKKVQIN